MRLSINLKSLSVLAGFLLAALFVSLSVYGQAGSTPKSKSMRVQLIGPVSTKTNHDGDEIVAKVIAPEEYNGDILEGVITKSKSGGSIKSTSELVFRFQTLHHQGEAKNVSVTLKSYTNSKGQEMVDEEGNLIKSENNLKGIVGKSLLMGAIGAAVGAAVGGAKGAAVGGVVGAGAAAITSVVYIKHKVQGANVTLGAGSTIEVEVAECDNCPIEKRVAITTPSQEKPERAAANTSRPTLTKRPSEKAPIQPQAAILKPEAPSTRFRTYTYANLARVSFPNNWKRINEDNSVAFAPTGGYLAQPGQAVIDYGMRMGVVSGQAVNPEQVIVTLLTSLKTTHTELQQVGQRTSTTLAGSPFGTARFRGRSTLNSQIVIADIYLTKIAEGRFFYLLTMVAEPDYPAYLEAFLTVRGSLQLSY